MAGTLAPDHEPISDLSEMVTFLSTLKIVDVINNKAVSRNADDTFYVEGCRQRLELWDAARRLINGVRP
jgi:hypothetical protein